VVADGTKGGLIPWWGTALKTANAGRDGDPGVELSPALNGDGGRSRVRVPVTPELTPP
jgi:hypothetical protein